MRKAAPAFAAMLALVFTASALAAPTGPARVTGHSPARDGRAAEPPSGATPGGSSAMQSPSADATLASLPIDSVGHVLAESALLVLPGRRHRPHTAQALVNAIVKEAPIRFQPPTCVAATAIGLTAKLTFNQCTGGRGVRLLSGELDETVSAGAGGAIDIHAAAVGLKVGQTTMTLTTDAVSATDGLSNSLSVTTSGVGASALGGAISRAGKYTMTWTDTCVAVAGEWQASHSNLTRTVTAQVKQCSTKCPTGSITVESLGRREMSITYDGSATARWQDTSGRSGVINLMCAP